MPDPVLHALGHSNPEAFKVADIIRQLVIKGGELGELEEYEFLHFSGEVRKGKRLWARWLERLGTAIENGSVERLSIDEVVQILLKGPR